MATQTRPLWQIAQDIRSTWTNPYFGAVPYIDAMSALESIDDDYYCDTADSVVMYFLSNARNWRGDDAKRIKAELKGML